MYDAFHSRSNVKRKIQHYLTKLQKLMQIFGFLGPPYWVFGKKNQNFQSYFEHSMILLRIVVRIFPIYKDSLLIIFSTDRTARTLSGICGHNEIGYNYFEKVKCRFKVTLSNF